MVLWPLEMLVGHDNDEATGSSQSTISRFRYMQCRIASKGSVYRATAGGSR